LTINKEMLREGVAQFGVTLSDFQLNQFEQYYQLLIEWNKKFNLTAITNPDEVVSKHFVDSLSSRYFLPSELDDSKIVDIGSGPGLPGVALKIAFPEINLLLIESIGKKARFLETLISHLDLKKTKVINTRVEGIPSLYPEYVSAFQFATARAVGRLLWLLELSAPLLAKDARLLLWKGRDQIAGLPKIVNEIKKRGFELVETKPYRIPLWNLDRFLVCLKRL
jgi:16S rRNA (guanine527-N7)-methyltransferase